MAEQLEPHILNRFEILQKLGKGAYGVVWKAQDKQTQQVVALKKVFDAFQNATDAQRTYREVVFLKELRGHANIVSLLNTIRAQNNKDLYLVFDFMETDLHAVIRANILEDVHRRYVLYQQGILKALKYMHSGQLIHRDLKPSNVLLDSDCLVKLADFGLARSIACANTSTSQPIMTEYVATRWYRAPQILLGSSKYTRAVDMWSVGCILGEMYVGRAIFPGNSTLNQVEKILELLGKPTREEIESLDSIVAKECLNQISSVSRKKSFASYFSSMDQQGLDLLRRLLVFNPKERLTVQEALSHPYMQDFHSKQEQKSFQGTIQIAIDQGKKYTVKQYRDALYREITATKKPPKVTQTGWASRNTHVRAQTEMSQPVSKGNVAVFGRSRENQNSTGMTYGRESYGRDAYSKEKASYGHGVQSAYNTASGSFVGGSAVGGVSGQSLGDNVRVDRVEKIDRPQTRWQQYSKEKDIVGTNSSSQGYAVHQPNRRVNTSACVSSSSSTGQSHGSNFHTATTSHYLNSSTNSVSNHPSKQNHYYPSPSVSTAAKERSISHCNPSWTKPTHKPSIDSYVGQQVNTVASKYGGVDRAITSSAGLRRK